MQTYGTVITGYRTLGVNDNFNRNNRGIGQAFAPIIEPRIKSASEGSISLFPSGHFLGGYDMSNLNHDDKERLKKFLDNDAYDWEVKEFLDELLEASFESVKNNSIESILKTLRSWASTADVVLDTEFNEVLQRGLQDLENGDTVEWKPRKAID